MILYKCVTPLENPPNIINSMICMAMWSKDENPLLGESLPKNLMLITMLAVPCMLIPKPLILWLQHTAHQRQVARQPTWDAHEARAPTIQDEEQGPKSDDEEEEPFDVSE